MEIIFDSIQGSRLYGTSYEVGENPLSLEQASDFDYRGVYVGSLENRLSLFNDLKEEVRKLENGNDSVYYELSKFFSLCVKGNPNIVEILHTPREFWRSAAQSWSEVIYPNRSVFLSKSVVDAYIGYAKSQEHRISNHRDWLVKFPHARHLFEKLRVLYAEQKIDFSWLKDWTSGDVAATITGETAENNTRFGRQKSFEELGLDEFRNYFSPALRDYLRLFGSDGNPVTISNSVFEKLSKQNSAVALGSDTYSIFEGGNGILDSHGVRAVSRTYSQKHYLYSLRFLRAEYQTALKHTRQMWDWVLNRNPQRADSEAKFFYDVKHAAHCIRLLSNLRSILKENDFSPVLSGEDLSLVRSVRFGLVPLEDFYRIYEGLMVEVKALEQKSGLPANVDKVKINGMFLDVVGVKIG